MTNHAAEELDARCAADYQTSLKVMQLGRRQVAVSSPGAHPITKRGKKGDATQTVWNQKHYVPQPL